MRDDEQRIVKWAHEAARSFAAGNIAGAEAYSREILDRAPEHAASLNLLGVIAARVGYTDLAIGYFERAAASNPLLARENLSIVRCAPMRAAKSDVERFLVIEAWGSGFWSDVCHVLGCCLLAEITGRIPVTHWGTNSLYTSGAADAFAHFFEPVSRFTLEDVLVRQGSSFFPSRWSNVHWPAPGAAKAAKSGFSGIYFLDRTETIAISDSYVSVFQLMPWIPVSHPWHGMTPDQVYRALVEKYLRPRGDVLAKAEAFHQQQLEGRPAIAVHVRGSDKWSEMHRGLPGPEHYFNVIDRNEDLIERNDQSARIFLLTDDERVLGEFRKRYGQRLVVTDAERTSSNIGLHMQYATDHVRLASEVMVDVFVARACNMFFGMGWSNVSAIIAMLKPWAPDTCFLLGPSILMDRFV